MITMKINQNEETIKILSTETGDFVMVDPAKADAEGAEYIGRLVTEVHQKSNDFIIDRAGMGEFLPKGLKF